jgi:molybdopterin synthase catalytic subunit
MGKEIVEIDLEKIRAGVVQRFKELEVRVLQVLGIVDPYFTRIVGGMMTEYKTYIIETIKCETVIEQIKSEVVVEGGEEK